VTLPGYERARTLIVLMGVARITQIQETLLSDTCSRRGGPAYPKHTPIAIIERASMPDQRVITSTLENIVVALDSNGEQRPPGMMVIGWSVLSLWSSGDVAILEENAEQDDGSRVHRWLCGEKWRVVEGLGNGWEGL
jgi:uroporphyrin-III C-methyltransferase